VQCSVCVDEFSNIREWADSNGMVINLHKTKEIVLHRPHPRPHQSNYLELCQSTFSFVDHVDYVLKICSQCIYLLKQLRDQGLPLHTVFQAIVLSRLMYALPAWGPLLNVELGPDFRKILGRSYENLRKFLRLMKILGKTYDNADFRKILRKI